MGTTAGQRGGLDKADSHSLPKPGGGGELSLLRPACAAGLDRREFAVCAGSVGLTMAESFLRHGRTGETAGAVPGMVRALEQALALAGA